jgi:hypothetical protein
MGSNPCVTLGHAMKKGFAARVKSGGKISRRDLTYGLTVKSLRHNRMTVD